jgi:hypothetical protein
MNAARDNLYHMMMVVIISTGIVYLPTVRRRRCETIAEPGSVQLRTGG